MKEKFNTTWQYYFVSTTFSIFLIRTINSLINIEILNFIAILANIIIPVLVLNNLINTNRTSLFAYKDNKKIYIDSIEAFKIFFSIFWRMIIMVSIIGGGITIIFMLSNIYIGNYLNKFFLLMNKFNLNLFSYQINFENLLRILIGLTINYFVGKQVFNTVINKVDFKDFKLKFE